MFFRYLDKAHPALKAAPARMSAAVIEDLYKKMDDLVGRVAAEPRPRERPVRHVRPRLQVLPPRRQPQLLAPPERLPGPRPRAGRRAASGSRTSIGTRTRAYGLGLGGLYLNLKGREAARHRRPGRRGRGPQGRARPASSTALKDGANGPAAITHVYDRDAVYAGPYKDNAPDLIIGYNEGYRASWDGVTGIVDATVIEDNAKAWSGDHCIDPALVPGVLFSSLRLKTRQARRSWTSPRPSWSSSASRRRPTWTAAASSMPAALAGAKEKEASMSEHERARLSAAGTSSRPASPPRPRSASAGRRGSRPRSHGRARTDEEDDRPRPRRPGSRS
ncbi:MAG: hypothetical protein M0C28_38775 [Candidatus Moduliflexus flocculans]|nr:hypothetical protein [Candidatus Moduliflexus flocculans]